MKAKVLLLVLLAVVLVIGSVKLFEARPTVVPAPDVEAVKKKLADKPEPIKWVIPDDPNAKG